MSASAAEMDNCVFSRCEQHKARSSLIKQSTFRQQTRRKVSGELAQMIDHKLGHWCGSAGAAPAGHMTCRVRKEGWDHGRKLARTLWAAKRINVDGKFSAHLISVRCPWSHHRIGRKWVSTAALQTGIKHEGSMTSDALALELKRFQGNSICLKQRSETLYIIFKALIQCMHRRPAIFNIKTGVLPHLPWNDICIPIPKCLVWLASPWWIQRKDGRDHNRFKAEIQLCCHLFRSPFYCRLPSAMLASRCLLHTPAKYSGEFPCTCTYIF